MQSTEQESKLTKVFYIYNRFIHVMQWCLSTSCKLSCNSAFRWRSQAFSRGCVEAEQQLCAGLVLPKSMFILDEVVLLLLCVSVEPANFEVKINLLMSSVLGQEQLFFFFYFGTDLSLQLPSCIF